MPDPTDDPHFRGLFIPHPIGPNRTRFVVMAAIRIEDEIVYVTRFWNGVGEPKCRVPRGMEGTTAAPHAAGTEYEYIVAHPDPEWVAATEHGRFIQRPNGSYPHSWEDPSRQDWLEIDP